jgi:predicted nucleic acid-binding protein
MTTWADLFERAPSASVAAVTAALDERRADDGPSDGDETAADAPDPGTDPAARVVADADVLAADLLVGGDARRALDAVREHSWVALLASDELLADAAAVVAALADEDVADAWRERAARERVPVAHPTGDHPGLATAYRGDARHLLTFDDGLAAAGTGAALNQHVDVSVRSPDAFAAVFDAASLYGVVVGGPYPGPDRDARG